jgi:hypothetical protein
LAPESEGDDGQQYVANLREDGLSVRVVTDSADLKRASEELEKRKQEKIDKRSEAAQKAAKEKGLELPIPMDPVEVDTSQSKREEIIKPDESNVGKGFFDGW